MGLMIKSFLLILGLIISSTSWSQSLSNGGGWSGSGGDTALFKDNVWFLKTKDSVPYCIWRSADYHFSYEELSSLVKESFRDWKVFFDKYGISQKRIPLRSHELMALDFQNIGACSSDKELPTGLMFVFGKTDNPHIKMYNQYGTENALGFAIRNKFYNHKTYQNPGYVWLSNSFKEKEKLKHMLLHELGHVFGMEHDSVFVMNTDVASWIKKESVSHNRFLGKIESPSWPFDFLPETPLTLTYQKVPLRNGMNRCPDNYFPYRLLPKRMMSILRPGPRRRAKGCFTLTLRWARHSGQQKLRHYELIITNLRGNTARLKGIFEVTRPDFIEAQTGPEVFTKWPNGAWGKGYFYKKKGMIPARGEFLLHARGPRRRQKEFRLPAKITIDKGITLEMVHPSFKKWWVLNSSSSDSVK
ncbi:MAG: hypothetical protein VYD54_10925 [Bdellovibrionota bacterium]|nr:hypothetical protein [Bdellovibrionota bacterium]